MATYKILSDRLSDLGKLGQTIDEEALQGANIEALISAEHIALSNSKKTEDVSENKETK
jgi:hypothetical protein